MHLTGASAGLKFWHGEEKLSWVSQAVVQPPEHLSTSLLSFLKLDLLKRPWEATISVVLELHTQSKTTNTQQMCLPDHNPFQQAAR